MNNEQPNKGNLEAPTKTPMTKREFKRQKRLISFRKKIGLLVLGSCLTVGIGNEVFKEKEEEKVETKVEPKIDQYTPPEQVFTTEERARLDKLISDGRVRPTQDPYTRNYLSIDKDENGKELEERGIQTVLLKRTILDREGKGHDVIAKKPVMERFLAAWKVLNEAGIYFTGAASHFSPNLVQDGIISRLKEGESGKTMNMAQGDHVRGQAIDVSQIGKNSVTPEGWKIGGVMRIFGFNWAIKSEKIYSTERAKNVAMNAKNNIMEKIDKMNVLDRARDVVNGKKSAEEVYGELKKEAKTAYAEVENNFGAGDFVHVSMNKKSLEQAPSIEEAMAKAREFLGLTAK